ncbi:MAG: serine/threonine protein kinase [Gemmatimonadaceae bacterium]|nr:serine/threonine protein kinase [Gemmatimonadaceae bacterium]
MTPSTATPLPAGLATSFETIRLLGAGGMGAVWLVRDRFLDRLVALKVLLADHADSEQRERFLREARTSARLEHPHIIDVYRADETDGVVWFTMRFIDGESLGDRLRERGALPASDVLRVLREVAWGLAYAHARGVVHRDIKPDNILLDRESGRAVLTDFGIARDASASALTQVGNVLGSVHYMSPEQASGEELDGRSDLYALGCVAYHALAGVPPFDGSAQSVLVAHVTKPLPPLAAAAPQLAASVVAVVERCLAKDPNERYASADELAHALDTVLREAELNERAEADAAPGGILSEADALAVWQRAAQLQAEAAHRMERSATLTSAASRRSGPHAAVEPPVDPGMLRVRDVEAAAVEAGISRQYVALALAEVRTRGVDQAKQFAISEAEDRRFTLFMGTADRAMSVSRVIPGAPRAVLAALGQVFTSPPRGLELMDTVNGHPLDGGIMRFKMPRFAEAYVNPFAAMSKDNALKYRLEQIELFELNVTLQPRGTAAAPACEVIITGDLRPGLRANLRLDRWLIALAGLTGGIGATVATAGATGGAGLVAYAMGAVGACIATVSCFAWYRWLFREALAKATEQLGLMLQGVEQQLATQRLFQGETEGR